MTMKLSLSMRHLPALAAAAVAFPGPAGDAAAQEAGFRDAARIISVDHYVPQISSVPSVEGEHTLLYLRERVLPATVLRGADLEGRVVLFVHGAGTPAEVAFDVPYQDYSWMAALAAEGFDAFSVDMTGYGRSTRPGIMNDPCNLSSAAQADLGLRPCRPSHVGAATTIESDWADIDRAIDYIRELRGVERVHLVGWSLGGPRAGGYSARNADKVGRLVLLAPAYNRDSAAEPSSERDERAVMSSQSRADFGEYWDTPFQCANQRDPVAGRIIFDEMLRSDPVGASWGPGFRRAPTVATWGWNAAVVRRSTTPLLAVAAAHDASVAPERVRELYEDYGADEKVLIDLGCATHGAMWESVHGLLFDASLEWLRSGTVNGEAAGIVRMGY